MKKTIALLLLLTTLFCSFGGCNTAPVTETPPDDNTVPENCYKLTVTGNTNMLREPLEPYYQAGTEVKIVTPVIMDSSIYVYVNNQKLDKERLPEEHIFVSTFIMPEEDVTVHLTHDEFYGRDEISFSELFYQLEYHETITKVSTKTFSYTPKYSLVETRYSSKPEDIANFLAISDQKLITASYDDIVTCDKISVYSFYYHNHRGEIPYYEFNFDDNYLCLPCFNPIYFQFKDPDYTLPTIEDPDTVTYAFRYDYKKEYLKKYGDENFSQEYTDLADIEFVLYEGEELNIEPEYYVESSAYGKINILTATVFEFEGKYYEIISGGSRWAYNTVYN